MLTEILKKRSRVRSETSCVRTRYVIESRAMNHVLVQGIPCVQFCNNDYLGIACHDVVKAACCDGIAQYGVGSSASALVTGYFSPQQLFETRMADFLGCERALLFNAGYLANIGVMTTLADRHSVVVSDKQCHASLIDGIQL